MSNIRVRKETGRLFLDFRVRGVRCREQTDLADTKANRKLLEKLEGKIQEALANGSYQHGHFFPNSKKILEIDEARLALQIAPTTLLQTNPAPSRTLPVSPNILTHPLIPLFVDFANQWYLEMEVQWKRSHKKTTRGILDNILIPLFGSRPVHTINKADILAFRSDLSKLPGIKNKASLSASRINHVMTPLRMILTEASDRFSFPPSFINIKPLRVSKTDVQPFTLQEVQDIIRTVRPDFQNYYTVRFFTGMRTSEIDGLKWQYVDFERRTISIKETIVDDYEETPKTGESERDIHLSQMVFDALLEQHKVTGQGAYVFATSAGTPISHRNISKRVWYPILRLLGLKKRIPYQTRHTFATLMLASGEAPEWIARQMGHTTTEMLFRVYSRFIPNLTRQDGSAFERLLTAQMHSAPLPVSTPNTVSLPTPPVTPAISPTSHVAISPILPSALPVNSIPPQPVELPKTTPSGDALSANPWLEIAKHAGIANDPQSNSPQ